MFLDMYEARKSDEQKNKKTISNRTEFFWYSQYPSELVH